MKKLIISVVSFILLLTINSQVKSEHPDKVSPNMIIENMDNQVKHDTLIVQGECGMCKTRIEKAANSVKGISSASWDIETKKLQFDYDPTKTSVDALSKAVAKVGHDTEKDKADPAAYKALPACCKYRGK